MREKDIPLNIRNTNDPEPSRHHDSGALRGVGDWKANRTVSSPASPASSDFSIITIAKNGMSSSQPAALRRVLEVFERHNHAMWSTLPSGIDSVSLVVQSGKAAPVPVLYAMGELQKEFQPG